MHRKEAYLQSPLRILGQSIRGGLGKGNLGVVLGPPGVGKSAFLVQIGLDALLRDRAVLHLAAGQTVERVSAWYDALLDDLAERVDLRDRGGVREGMARRRLIQAFPEGAFVPDLRQALATFEQHLGVAPAVLLIDGFVWSGQGCTASLQALKAAGRAAGAEIWMTSLAARGFDPRQPGDAIPCAGCAPLVDVGLFLEPNGSHVEVWLVKDFDDGSPRAVHLALDGDTLRPLRRGDPAPAVKLPAHSFTLLATGAAGAEAEFGACAERWGLSEVNFTFSPRDEPARQRGLVELSEDELKLGQVSPAYLTAHMHRSYPDTAEFRRVLGAIWHQVSTAGEVFAVGTLLPDDTVHGGTGWAVELARHWGKPVHVFDQDRGRWFAWSGRGWVEEPAPAIMRERFAGSGTRSLSDGGRRAIRELFERSFGAR